MELGAGEKALGGGTNPPLGVLEVRVSEASGKAKGWVVEILRLSLSSPTLDPPIPSKVLFPASPLPSPPKLLNVGASNASKLLLPRTPLLPLPCTQPRGPAQGW